MAPGFDLKNNRLLKQKKDKEEEEEEEVRGLGFVPGEQGGTVQ